MPPQAISEDLHWAVVCMASVLKIEDIVAYSGVSRSKVYEILALHHETRNVVHQVDSHRLGCPHHLSLQDVTVSNLSSIHTNSYSVQFLHSMLNKQCDLYLSELQSSFLEMCGVSVSQSTVWKALQCSGYTMKKVNLVSTFVNITNMHYSLHVLLLNAVSSSRLNISAVLVITLQISSFS